MVSRRVGFWPDLCLWRLPLTPLERASAGFQVCTLVLAGISKFLSRKERGSLQRKSYKSKIFHLTGGEICPLSDLWRVHSGMCGLVWSLLFTVELTVGTALWDELHTKLKVKPKCPLTFWWISYLDTKIFFPITLAFNNQCSRFFWNEHGPDTGKNAFIWCLNCGT